MDFFLLLLPREKIVLVSWIVSEYDGLGYVTTTALPENCGEDRAKGGAVFLFFPEGRREDVLELLSALKSEGMTLAVHSEGREEDFSDELQEEIYQPEGTG